MSTSHQAQAWRGAATITARLREFTSTGRSEWRVILGRQGHGDVDVLEDLTRGNAYYSVGRLDEVVTFASGVLAAESVDEAEGGTELFGFDQKPCAVGFPIF
jgi:hypothetical protein